ncbi:MAG: hypothetical protein KDA28_11025, partial [Phycisphaerales bacterium]|nr:hypothetical protein [Phycisphaerales bacterium]
MMHITDANGRTHRLIRATFDDAPWHAAIGVLFQRHGIRDPQVDRGWRLASLLVVTAIVVACSLVWNLWIALASVSAIAMLVVASRRPLHRHPNLARDAHVAVD